MAVTFVNYKQVVTTAKAYKRIKTYKVAFSLNCSCFVYNQSYTRSAVVRIMISPDKKVWMADGGEVEVDPRELLALTPNYFSKYLRLEYKSKRPDYPAKLTVWFQMTRPPAKKCYSTGNDPS